MIIEHARSNCHSSLASTFINFSPPKAAHGEDTGLPRCRGETPGQPARRQHPGAGGETGATLGMESCWRGPQGGVEFRAVKFGHKHTPLHGAALTASSGRGPAAAGEEAIAQSRASQNRPSLRCGLIKPLKGLTSAAAPALVTFSGTGLYSQEL